MRISDWSSDVCSSDLYSQRALPWWKSAPDPEAIRLPLGPLRWGPVPVPQGEELTFLTGLRSMTTAGDVALQTGMAAHLYLVNAPMRREYFRSEEHTSELQSLMRISYDVFCLKKTNTTQIFTTHEINS